MTFSVALCTFNGARHLGLQLESLARQQYKPEELVVCDDQSSDESVEILEAFALKAPFPVRIIRNESNLGYANNFRKAVRLCAHETIAFCDQDDIWHPEKLKRLAEEFEKGGERAGGVFSNGTLIDTDDHLVPGDLWSSFRFTAADQKQFQQGRAIDVLTQRNVVTGMAFAVRRQWTYLLDELPTSWPHDAWLAIRIAEKAKLVPCPDLLVAYRVHGSQQIGVPITATQKRQFLRKNGLSAYLELSRKRNLREFEADAAMFDGLLTVLEKEGDVTSHLFARAQGKSAFAHAGISSLQLERRKRWLPVLSQAQNYRRFTKKGLSAAVRDLLL